MRGYSLSRLVTGACVALFLLAAIQARADFIYPVTSAQSLADVAAKIKNTIDSGTHVVRISAYAKVGQFRLDNPPAKVQTLIFERDSLQQSDSALRISGDTALLEIKNMRRGTVILRGLAFQLASPESRFIAGAEPGKENLHLIIDSCFIFGDNNASSFLTWLGVGGSKIEIRRSFFVFKAGDSQKARAILTGTSMDMANNLFHFDGQVSATVLPGGLFDFRTNTVHRTQLKLTSEDFLGARYQVTRNFIGHRPGQDTFGQRDPYFFLATNFDPSETFVFRNVILSSWQGLVHPGTVPFHVADSSNKVRDTLGVKPVTELWNWYGTEGAIDSTGLAFGRDRRAESYNVLPGTDSISLTIESYPTKVFFKPAPFPRQFKAARIPMPIPAGLDSVRFHSPNPGALHFGPFQVDSIRMNILNGYGDALLFSNDSTLQFRPQRIGSRYPATLHVFPNDLPTARYFHLAFKGNTPRGIQVSPDRTSSLAPGDSLSFGKVDSAGFTEIYVEAREAYPDSLRYLGRTFSVRTSAAVSGTMVFGSGAPVTPHWIDQVYWWRPKDALLHPASIMPGGGFLAYAPAAAEFNAYLVEKLTVKKGGKTVFPLPGGGEVRASSANGFQLRIDSAYRPDGLHFGQASLGFSLAFAGRQAGDTVILRLPGGPDTEVFQVAGSSFPTVPTTPDSLGFHEVPISSGDTGIRLFSGIRFNVIAGREFNDTLAGVGIAGLISSRSGKLSILPFNPDLLTRGIGTQDTLPSNAKLLGGKAMRSLLLATASPWSATLAIARPGDSARVAAYAWDGLKWRSLPSPVVAPGEPPMATVAGLGSADQAFAVLELLKPASEYVTMVPVIGNRSLSVMVIQKDPVHQPIKQFSVRIRHVDERGKVDTLELGPADVGQTLTWDPANRSGLFQYAVIYRTAEGDYNRPSYVPITAFGWNPARMSVGGAPRKAGQQWHMLGFPYRTTLEKSLAKREKVVSEARDTLEILRLKTAGGKTDWESVSNAGTLMLEPGDAFLFSSSHVQEHLLDSAADFVDSLGHPIGPHGGWRFVSPPYPMEFLASAVGSNKGKVGTFLELKMDPGGKERAYKWEPTDRLKAFAGYAYKFLEDEVLTFNPWTALAPIPSAKRGESSASAGAVRLTLQVEGRTRSMRFLSGSGVREMPYLPAPEAGLEMRVGGQGGWFLKRLDDLLGIDESVIIRSPSSARSRMDFGLEGEPAERKDWQARLIHLASGKVLDPAAGFTLAKGEQEYRLVAGSEAFLAERISAFRSGLPAGLGFSQNYPNPFRAQTRIDLEWPALAGGAVAARKARLEVFDSRGRRVHSLDLGEVRAGRQVITLDGSRWKPGLYTYRLTVDQAGSRARLQKRLVVSP